MEKEIIHVEPFATAYARVPTSPVVKGNGFVFVSGMVPVNPENGEFLRDGDIEEQVRCCLESIKALLEGAGSSLDKVVKTTVFLSDMKHFATMNQVYAQYFPSGPPARTTVGVALVGGFDVEIECTALA